MTRGKNFRVPSIDDVRSRFEQWRQTRQGKIPIPDELRSVAAAAARPGWCQSGSGCLASGWRETETSDGDIRSDFPQGVAASSICRVAGARPGTL
jgi:hypothetical protein